MVSESHGHRLPSAHSPRRFGSATATERRAGRSDARPGHGLSGISHCVRDVLFNRFRVQFPACGGVIHSCRASITASGFLSMTFRSVEAALVNSVFLASHCSTACCDKPNAFENSGTLILSLLRMRRTSHISCPWRNCPGDSPSRCANSGRAPRRQRRISHPRTY